MLQRSRWETNYCIPANGKCGAVYGHFEGQNEVYLKFCSDSFLRNAATQIQPTYLFYIVFLLEFLFKLLKMRSRNMAGLSCSRLQIHSNMLGKVYNEILKNNINKILFLWNISLYKTDTLNALYNINKQIIF